MVVTFKMKLDAVYFIPLDGVLSNIFSAVIGNYCNYHVREHYLYSSCSNSDEVNVRMFQKP